MRVAQQRREMAAETVAMTATALAALAVRAAARRA
jgi:hypothetical protein